MRKGLLLLALTTPVGLVVALAVLTAGLLFFFAGPSVSTVSQQPAAGQPVCPGLSWSVLAGIGKVESDHGRSTLPGVHSGTNSAGAAGPMQFLFPTWNGRSSTTKLLNHVAGMDDIYAHRDASFGAARYLCNNGAAAAGGLRGAVFQYNHAWWYVDEVLNWANAYSLPGDVPSSVARQDIPEGALKDYMDAQPLAAAMPVAAVLHQGDPFEGACRPVLTQAYGPVDNRLEPAVHGAPHFHTGLDLACVAGTPIHTVTDGVAHTTTGCTGQLNMCGGGFGNNVVVEATLQLPGNAAAQHYFIRYAHMVRVLVADGAAVHAGDMLGLEGTTGESTGPHLHFEVDLGSATVANSVNPAPLLAVA